MTYREFLQTAMEQSAADIHCQPADFLRPENMIVPSLIGPEARKYYREPVGCNLVSYGSNVVASVKEALREIVADYLGRYACCHCFETPNLHVLEAGIRPLGWSVCFMAEYFLPDPERLRLLPCPYEMRVLDQGDFAALYLPEWSNALCADRRELDVLGVGAYDGGRLVGLAACSADCERMWQIGIDVLPAYRRRGIAAALTSRLTQEILQSGRVPFYCSAWSNLRSVGNALKCGFRPAWVEMTAKPLGFVEKLNGPPD